MFPKFPMVTFPHTVCWDWGMGVAANEEDVVPAFLELRV